MTYRIGRQEKLPLLIHPRGGAVGTVVSLTATGLPPESRLIIAFANLHSYELLQRVVTDADGTFSTTEEVPAWADLDGVHYFFASFSDEKPLALSDGFHVTAADGTARVRGTIESVAGGCVDMRNAGDVLYHLVGDVGEREEGERVSVVGSITDDAACGGKGVVIDVREITPRSR